MPSEWPKGFSEPRIQKLSKEELSKFVFSQNMERPPITSEEREHLEKELVSLSKLMSGSKCWWQLDGSLNLSLRKKEMGEDYIGAHSDVDISVLRDDLERLEQYLKGHGYGLFLRSKENNERIFRRVGHAVFSRQHFDTIWESPYIVAINEHGEINKGADLVRMQTYVIDIDSEGNPSERGISYPREWLQGETVKMNGVSIVLSHPARHLLFKIWYTREYDEKDIQEWRRLSAVSKEDIDKLESILLSMASNTEWRTENPGFDIDEESLRRRIELLRKL